DERRRGCGSTLRVVARTAADLAETGARIERAGRFISLLDLKEKRAHAETREPSHMQIEQRTRVPAPACGRCDRDREDFGFVSGAARHDEADRCASARHAVRNDAAIGEQLLEFLLAPAAVERRAMECGKRRRI